jgi:hypothetical protein
MNYEELNWPTLPEDIEARLLDFCQTEPDTNAVNFATMAVFGKVEFFQFAAPDYLVQWVRENITLDNSHVVQLQVWKYTDQGKRHIDRKRDFSYNYLLMEHPGITRWFDDDGSQTEMCYGP